MRIKFLNKVMLVIILIICVSNGVYADELDKLIIAGDINYPPYEFLDEQGNYSGFNVDIMRAISIELGIDIVLVPMEWNKSIEALKNGEVDAIQGMTYSIERETVFDFSESLIVNSQQIFVNSNSMAILTIEDLDGKKVAFQEGDVNYEWIKKQVNIEPIYKKDQSEAMNALIDGEVDAFVGNRHTGLYNIQKSKNVEHVKIVGEGMHDKVYATVVLNGNNSDLAIINKGLKIVKNNGTYEKIYKKWFGEYFIDKTMYWRKLMVFSSVILLIVMLIAVVIAYLNRKLKEEVEKRTKEIILQKKLIEDSNRFRGQILESIDNGIITFDSGGDISSINATARSLLGWKNLCDSTYKEILKELGVVKFPKIMKGSCIWYDELKGSIHLEYRCLPINDEGRNAAMLVLYDTTIEKHLQSIVNQKDKMVSIGRLSAGVAHELRNPLTAIKVLVDMMPTKLHDKVFTNRMQSILPKEINRLDTLVESLLDYSKPKVSSPEKFVIEDVLASVLSLHSVYLSEHNIDLKVNYSKELTVVADKNQLKQVIINILRNAVDAIGERGSVSISTYVEGEFAIIKITDDGSGIPDIHLKSIFEPFFTLKAQGYGIGLSICQQLILENNGKIIIESKEGEGTTVKINLPI